MKRFMTSILFVLVLLCVCSAKVSAQDESFQKQYDELLHSSGADKLFEIVPEDAKGILEDTKISDLSQESLLQISFFDFVVSIWESIKNSVSK
ncbi:MAG: hypothetical protein RR612_10280, partial [Oscillospiraceae bacterium]